MNGLLLIDKPQGVTSHDVVRRIRQVCRLRKVGHAGTLDPLATGVLPVALGEGTKILQFLQDADKSYRATVRFGQTTTTQDAEGELVAEGDWHGLTEAVIRQACAALTGDIDQLPPMYSALKKDGVPLYRLARQGIEVERELRRVRIDRFALLSVALPVAEVAVDCSKGTYIRTLCHDLGQSLGCGAHITSLQRTRVGRFALDRCCPLPEKGADAAVLHGCLLDLDTALAHLPALDLPPAAGERLRHGVAPARAVTETLPAVAPGTVVRLRCHDQLMAVAARLPLTADGPSDFRLIRVLDPEKTGD